MHLRINIPAWGARAIARGTSALLRGGASYRVALEKELTVFAQTYASNATNNLPQLPADNQSTSRLNKRPVLVSSARYGLQLACEALQLAGKRVAVPAFVCPAVLTGLRAAQVEIVLIDCAADSLRFDSEALARAAHASAFDAILAANTYGFDQDFAVLNSFGAPVIEDAAYQASYVDDATNAACGLRGHAGVWSFNFKALTGVGGGVLWTDAATAAQLKRQLETAAQTTTKAFNKTDAALFANYALRALAREHLPRALGGAQPPTEEPNTRAAWQTLRAAPMSELQAALALTQWRKREYLQQIQSKHTRILRAAVAPLKCFASPRDTEQHNAVHLFPLLLAETDEARAQGKIQRIRLHLHARGVQTETPYPLPFDAQAARTFPYARSLRARLLLVPCNASLSARRIAHIADAITDAARELK